MWFLDFVQERFHNINPSDFESTQVQVIFSARLLAGDSETRKGLGWKKQQNKLMDKIEAEAQIHGTD